MNLKLKLIAIGLAGALLGAGAVLAAGSFGPALLLESAAPAGAQPAPTSTPGPAPAQPTPGTERAPRGFLGVAVRDVTSALTERYGLRTNVGAVIVRVEPDSPAARAGLQEGDVITAVNGVAVTNAPQAVEAIGRLAPNTAVQLTINRAGATQMVSATLAERPQRQAKASPKRPPVASFGELSEGQLTYIDPNGQRVTVTVVAGEVQSASATSLTVKPRGSNQTRTFQVTANTQALVGPGGVAGLRAGDQVTVWAKGDPNVASVVTRGGRHGFAPFGKPFIIGPLLRERPQPAPAPSGATS